MARRVRAFALAAFFVVSQVGVAQARSAPDSFSSVVQKLSPTVVNISTTQLAPGKTAVRASESPSASGTAPLAGMIGRSQEKMSGGSVSGGGQSLGSGFIVDPSGYIVTNQHVIADAQTIVVTTHAGQRMSAKLVGVDSKTDLALLKVVTRSPLPFVVFGDSDKADVGDWVVVIGNPYGLGGSVSAGIVSARNRELNLGSYDDFIQTDAAINSGNSGGPLFNLAGEVVGVNSALLSPSGGSVGIGFAISANLAKPIIGQLRSYGEARRGWIGVRVQTVTSEIAESVSMPAPRGALVSNVTPNGPADRAGLIAGDVVLKFDGKDIAEMRIFPRAVAESTPGRNVATEVFRRGKVMTFQVPVERLEGSDKSNAATRPSTIVQQASSARPSTLGMTLSGLTADLRSRFGVPMGVNGAVVMDVSVGSTAAENDVRIGDVVVGIAQAPVKSMEDVRASLDVAQKAAKRVVLLALSRRGDVSFKALRF